jgi:hypothetical protein
VANTFPRRYDSWIQTSSLLWKQQACPWIPQRYISGRPDKKPEHDMFPQVNHPCSNHTQCCLTSVITRESAYSLSYVYYSASLLASYTKKLITKKSDHTRYLYQKDKRALPGNLQNRRHSFSPPPLRM